MPPDWENKDTLKLKEKIIFKVKIHPSNFESFDENALWPLNYFKETE